MDGEKRILTFLLKMVVVGDTNVGKTTFLLQHLGRLIDSKHSMTIKADFSLRTSVIEGRQINYQIWVLAGHRSLGPTDQSIILEP